MVPPLLWPAQRASPSSLRCSAASNECLMGITATRWDCWWRMFVWCVAYWSMSGAAWEWVAVDMKTEQLCRHREA